MVAAIALLMATPDPSARMPFIRSRSRSIVVLDVGNDLLFVVTLAMIPMKQGVRLDGAEDLSNVAP